MPVTQRLQPTARQVRLGRIVATGRTDKSLSQDALAKSLGFSESKISRIESGRIGVSVTDLKEIGRALGFEPDLLAYALDLRAKGDVQDWEANIRNTISVDYADFIGYEGDAYQAFSLETTLVPGLLQTEEYSLATIRYPVELPTVEASQERLRIKRQRQLVFDRAVPLKFWAIISESAFRHSIGGPEVMKPQLLHLIELAEKYPGIINIQVLPEGSPAHAGIYGPYMILTFRQKWEPDIVYIEGLTGTRWIEKQEHVQDHMEHFQSLMANAALRQDQSLELIQAHADRL
jgi:transcriptional regulator with XRE-family HTH domain